jgi:hypothetical protein
MDTDDEEDIFFAYWQSQQSQKKPAVDMRTGQRGYEYMREFLDRAHPERIRHILRMELATFKALQDWLLANTKLRGDDIQSYQKIIGKGRRVSIQEKLAIFIHIVSRPASNRDTAEYFQRSGETVSR